MRPALLSLTLLIAGCASAPSPPLRVAAASSLRFALEEIAAEFQADRTTAPLDIVYGSSGALYQQIRNGAPFDLFLFADAEYPSRLAAEGFVLEGSQFVYAVGRLVLWRRGGEVDERTLADPTLRKVAIANPAHAPYGQAAAAALRSLGVYDRLEDKLVLGDNVAQALHFVQSGGADLGVIALPLALAPTVEGRYWELPRTAFPRLEQRGAILRAARDPAAAAAFRDHALSPRGRSILDRYGLTLPESE